MCTGNKAPTFETIEWRAVLDAADRPAADRILERMRAALDAPLHVEEYTRWWKAPELAEVVLTTPLHVSNPAAALHRTLTLAWRLASDWTVSQPVEEPDYTWYDGIAKAGGASATQMFVPCLHWIIFEIRNFRVPAPDEPGASG